VRVHPGKHVLDRGDPDIRARGEQRAPRPGFARCIVGGEVESSELVGELRQKGGIRKVAAVVVDVLGDVSKPTDASARTARSLFSVIRADIVGVGYSTRALAVKLVVLDAAVPSLRLGSRPSPDDPCNGRRERAPEGGGSP
jgi:hypothetical protein